MIRPKQLLPTRAIEKRREEEDRKNPPDPDGSGAPEGADVAGPEGVADAGLGAPLVAAGSGFEAIEAEVVEVAPPGEPDDDADAAVEAEQAGAPEPETAPSKPKAGDRGHRIPDDFEARPEVAAEAAKFGFVGPDFERCLAEFCDHLTAEARGGRVVNLPPSAVR